MQKNNKKMNKQAKPFCLLNKRPELRADARAVTLLRTQEEFYGKPCFATKQWLPSKRKPIRFDIGEMFQPFVAPAEDIRQLAALLAEAALDPRMLLIRGAVKEVFINEALVNRRNNEHADKPAPNIEEVPRHIIPIDLDEAPEPEGCNYLENPARSVIEAVKLYLPAPFHSAAFCYEYSSSAGFPGKEGLRVHIYFYSERAITSNELRTYFDKQMPRFPLNNATTGETDMVGFVDLSLYQCVQPHYIAAPIIDPKMTDPLAGRRRGLVAEGRAMTVALPEAADIKPGKDPSADNDGSIRVPDEQPSDSQVQELLKHCKLSAVDNDKKKRRDVWFQIGGALKTVYASDVNKGFSIFDSWAKQYRRVSTTLRHSGLEFSEYFRLSLVVC